MHKSTCEVSHIYFVDVSVGCASGFGFTESSMFGLTELTRFLGFDNLLRVLR